MGSRDGAPRVAGRTSGERAFEDAFLQRRVAALGLALGLIGLAGLALRGGVHLAFGEPASSFLSGAWGAHLLACLLPLALYLSLRTGVRGRATIHISEAFALGGVAFGYQMVGTYLDIEARPDYAVLLAMTVVMVARAAYVPSVPWRTLLLTAGMGLPMLTVTYVGLVSRLPDPAIPDHAPFTRTLNAGIWWTLITVLSALITRTIYGLRIEVREAKKLGQYSLEARIATGGMGEVYRARHALLRRPTAVKLIRPELVGEDAIARFEAEAQRTASLTHPNTVTVYDYGRTEDGILYYAMELLEGADLDAIVEATGAMHPGRACAILAGVAGALDEAHRAELIHRDIKPSNILLVERAGTPDVPKVIDFGLVEDARRERTDDDRGDGLTIVGTPRYLSPEAIARPDSVDARSDLYSLGAVAYFLLTGRPVFEGDEPMALYEAHLRRPPEPPSAHTDAPLPRALDQLVLACLAKRPEDRPQSAREIEVRLRDLQGALAPWDDVDARRWWRENAPALSPLVAANGASARSAKPMAPAARPEGAGPAADAAVRKVAGTRETRAGRR